MRPLSSVLASVSLSRRAAGKARIPSDRTDPPCGDDRPCAPLEVRPGDPNRLGVRGTPGDRGLPASGHTQ